MNRSLAPLLLQDIERLGDLAAADRKGLFMRKPHIGALYNERLFAVALCQGGALHFLDGRTGINDLDVWSFFVEHPKQPFPYRRRAEVDFGDPKFGVTDGYSRFVGRKVDLIGRSLPNVDPSDPVGTLRKYLTNGTTETARCLALKAAILIEPVSLLGTVVWPSGI